MGDILISAEYVEVLNRDSIPENGETILSEFGKPFFNEFSSLSIYFRNEQECHLGRGNWVADLKTKEGKTFCIKLPKQMKEEKVYDYFRPLISFLRNKMS